MGCPKTVDTGSSGPQAAQAFQDTHASATLTDGELEDMLEATLAEVELGDTDAPYKAPLQFGRRIHRVLIDKGINPEKVDPFDFIAWAEKLGYELGDPGPDEAAASFIRGFDGIRCPAGMDPFDVAVWKSQQIEIAWLPDSLRPEWRRIAKIAYCLQRYRGNQSIQLPTHRLSDALGISVQHACNILHVLVKMKVIQCTNEYFSLKDHKAKEYRFVYPKRP